MKLDVLREAIKGRAHFTKEDAEKEIIPFLVANDCFDPEEEARALEHYRYAELQKGLRSLKKDGHRVIVSTKVETKTGEVIQEWYQPRLCSRPRLEYLRGYALQQVDHWKRQSNWFTSLINLKFGGQIRLPFPDVDEGEEAA